MKTKIKPIKVEFDTRGYEDLMSKIESLEDTIKSYERGFTEYQSKVQTLKDNLQDNFEISDNDVKSLFDVPNSKIFIEQGINMKPIFHIRYQT